MTKAKNEELEELKRRADIAKFAILGELLFVLLPMIVISIVAMSMGKTILAVIETPEWSFGAAVLFGQAIAKLVAGFSRIKPETWEKPVFFVSIITVVGLVPTLIVLTLLLALDPVPVGLKIAQLPLFILGMAVFYCFGIAGHAQTHIKAEELPKP